MMRRSAALAVVVLVGIPGGVAVAEMVKRADGQGPRLEQPLRATASCRTTRTLVIVNLDNRKHRGTLRHAWAARAQGQPTILHKLVGEDAIDANRDASLQGVPLWSRLSKTRRERLDPAHWQEPHDRDEYPPAATREGGTGADVAYVLRGDNRSAGQAMGARLAEFCEDQRWRYEFKSGPR